MTEKSIQKEAYGIYIREYYNEHDCNMTPVCLAEFIDNEWQDEEIRNYYLSMLSNEFQSAEVRSLAEHTDRGVLKATTYDDGIANGMHIWLGDEIIAAVDVYRKTDENDTPEIKVLVYQNPFVEEPDMIRIEA